MNKRLLIVGIAARGFLIVGGMLVNFVPLGRAVENTGTMVWIAE